MPRLTLPDFTPHAGQKRILAERRMRNVACMGRRFGKALALDTPIPTPTGWTTMGVIKDGDFVFDENGNHCRVLHAHPIMVDRPCCVVTFSDGAQVVCDEDHLWRTWDRKARKNKARNDKRGGGQSASRSAPLVRSTAEIASTLKSGKGRNHSIECCMPLQMPDADLPIRPYTLGVWIGDGSSTSAAYYKPDAEIADYIRADGYPVKKGNAPFEWRISDGVKGRAKECFQKDIRNAGLLGNKR